MTVLSGLGSDTTARGTATIEVLDGGPFTTVQDVPGRIGYWHVGVPPNGPMDDLAHRLVNRVLGNHAHAAALELTTQGPTLRFTDDATIAVGGAAMPVHVDGRRKDHYAPIHVRAGATVTIGPTAGLGMRATLGVRGGIDVAPFLGSRSTFMLGVFGGHEGRTLAAGDALAIGDDADDAVAARPLAPGVAPLLRRDWELGVLVGPHTEPELLEPGGIEALCARRGRCTSTRRAPGCGSSGRSRGGHAPTAAKPACTHPTSTTPATRSAPST
jgi:urea carboxylase